MSQMSKKEVSVSLFDEVGRLRHQLARRDALLKEITEYLDRSHREEIHAGSVFHQEMKNVVNTDTTSHLSRKANAWIKVSADVVEHIEDYVVPQYGDDGDDPATDYNAEECFKQAERYLKRRNSNSRPGQELMDVRKSMHWLSIAYDKVAAELLKRQEVRVEG